MPISKFHSHIYKDISSDNAPLYRRRTQAPASQIIRQKIKQHTMAALRTLGPKAAAALDEELMSSGAFSIDQLMELAGLVSPS